MLAASHLLAQFHDAGQHGIEGVQQLQTGVMQQHACQFVPAAMTDHIQHAQCC